MNVRTMGRFLALGALVLALALPALAATLQRVCNINAVVANPAIKLYKVYASAGLQGSEAKGTVSIGPPAWDDQTEYFTGNVTAVERVDKGVRLAASGTFGTRVSSTREAASAFVEVVDGKVSVSGLPPEYCVQTAKTESGSISIYPAPAPASGQ